MMLASCCRVLARALVAVGTITLAATPANAFDRFISWSAALSANPDGERGSSLFRYYAPKAGLRDEDISELVRISADFRFLRTMIDAELDEVTLSLTGIDFSAVRAGMVSTIGGDMRHLLDVEVLDPVRVEAAYSARGFEVGEADGRTVLHIGEDGTWDGSRVSQSDPFELGLGDAQRIALIDNTVAVSSRWDSIRMLVGELNGRNACTGCVPWREMADSLRKAAGDDAHLDIASGKPGRFAFEGYDIAALGADAVELPDFSLVMLAVTEKDDSYTPHIVVHFSSLDDARTGAKEIARRAGGIALSSSVLPSQRPVNTPVYAVEGGAVAIVTFATGDLDWAYRTLGNWELAIGSKEFPPLARR